ncbi:hypothetical protein [Stenotrophomonas phage CM2]
MTKEAAEQDANVQGQLELSPDGATHYDEAASKYVAPDNDGSCYGKMACGAQPSLAMNGSRPCGSWTPDFMTKPFKPMKAVDAEAGQASLPTDPVTPRLMKRARLEPGSCKALSRTLVDIRNHYYTRKVFSQDCLDGLDGEMTYERRNHPRLVSSHNRAQPATFTTPRRSCNGMIF